MSPQVARMKARQRSTSPERPFLVELLAVRFPSLGHFLIDTMMRLPHGRLRRMSVEWVMRDLAVGAINRNDLEVVRALAAPDFTLEAAPQLLALQGRELKPLVGVESAIAFLREWFEGWGGFAVVPQEIVDFGDGRVLLLNHLVARGAASGVELERQEDAQLWRWGPGGGRGGRQWWSWREALEAVGLSE